MASSPTALAGKIKVYLRKIVLSQECARFIEIHFIK